MKLRRILEKVEAASGFTSEEKGSLTIYTNISNTQLEWYLYTHCQLFFFFFLVFSSLFCRDDGSHCHHVVEPKWTHCPNHNVVILSCRSWRVSQHLVPSHPEGGPAAQAKVTKAASGLENSLFDLEWNASHWHCLAVLLTNFDHYYLLESEIKPINYCWSVEFVSMCSMEISIPVKFYFCCTSCTEAGLNCLLLFQLSRKDVVFQELRSLKLPLSVSKCHC